MGIGLALAKAFVELHGGTIQVDSQPGRGTTFHIRLPRIASGARRRRSPFRGRCSSDFAVPPESGDQGSFPPDVESRLVTLFTSVRGAR